MSIAEFFDKTVVIRRLRDVAGTDRRSYQATATADCAIQEQDRQDRIASGFVSERTWIAYFDLEQGINEGDILTDSLAKRYKVIEVTRKDYGINVHLQVILIEYNP